MIKQDQTEEGMNGSGEAPGLDPTWSITVDVPGPSRQHRQEQEVKISKDVRSRNICTMKQIID